MTLPEGWPTLQEIMRATAHLANGDAPDWHVNYRLTNAASFAVTAYPALVALRDQLDSWAQVAAAQQDTIAGTFVGVSFRLDEILALAKLAKETPRE